MPGDADDAVLLAEQIKGFDSLVGKADDPLRWKHSRGLTLFCCDCGLLTDDQPLDHAPHVHSVGVGGDVDEALFAELVDPRADIPGIAQQHSRPPRISRG